MTIHLTIDDELVEEARTVGKHQTEIEAVTEALQEYIERRRQLQVLNLFGTIDYAPEYNYKEQRRRQ